MENLIFKHIKYRPFIPSISSFGSERHVINSLICDSDLEEFYKTSGYKSLKFSDFLGRCASIIDAIFEIPGFNNLDLAKFRNDIAKDGVKSDRTSVLLDGDKYLNYLKYARYNQDVIFSFYFPDECSKNLYDVIYRGANNWQSDTIYPDDPAVKKLIDDLVAFVTKYSSKIKLAVSRNEIEIPNNAGFGMNFVIPNCEACHVPILIVDRNKLHKPSAFGGYTESQSKFVLMHSEDIWVNSETDLGFFCDLVMIDILFGTMLSLAFIRQFAKDFIDEVVR